MKMVAHPTFYFLPNNFCGFEKILKQNESEEKKEAKCTSKFTGPVPSVNYVQNK